MMYSHLKWYKKKWREQAFLLLVFSRVSRSWKAFPSRTLRRDRNCSADNCQMSGSVSYLKRGFQSAYLCLWCVSAKWLNFTRISFALKHTGAKKTNKKNKQIMHILHNPNIIQTLQLGNHTITMKTCWPSCILTFPGMRRAGRRAPYTWRCVVWENLQREKPADRAVFDRSRQFPHSQSVDLPKYMCCSYIVYLFAAIWTVNLPTSDQQVKEIPAE